MATSATKATETTVGNGRLTASKADLEAGMRQVHREGQGVWIIRVIFPNNIPELLKAALAG